MLYLPILLAAAASLASAAAVNIGEEKLQFQYYCNAGTEGNGNCESSGYHTYCCTKTQWGTYQTPRTIALGSTDSQGNTSCDGGNGSIYCA
ncbi:hypothetical protein E4U21_006592 [Claviceps maximensis]|nr:hypothetical protein E4U21_006592 [Claviceps maximensis]